MKVLVTGGSGFIGTHLIRHLLDQQECEILNIDIQSPKFTSNRLKYQKVDIRDKEALVKSIDNHTYDLCIHLAALCKEPGYEWDEYFETNHLGTKNVIALCENLNIKSIIFTSTMMVYKADEERRTENSITSPDTAYGISKLLGEKELVAWLSAAPQERTIKIIRPAVVFGESENGNFTRLYKTIRRGVFPYVGKKTTVKSNIYVKELVLFIAFLNSRRTNKNVYNFSFPETLTIEKIVLTFKSVFRMKSFNPILPYYLLLLAARMFEVLNAVGIRNSIHHRRIQKLYNSTNIYPQSAIDEGYKFTYDLSSALKDWKKYDSLIQ